MGLLDRFFRGKSNITTDDGSLYNIDQNGNWVSDKVGSIQIPDQLNYLNAFILANTVT